jgi:two-component system response regulator YesN
MLKAMIVDDYQIFRRCIRDLDIWGEKSGFIITDEAEDGNSALNILHKRSVDLVITDIRMPFVNGLELLKAINAEGLCPCVILISEFSEFEYARQGIQNGAFDYILKPVDLNDLLKKLQRAEKFIQVRKTDLKIKHNLDMMISQKIDDHYPKEIVNYILKSITDGDEKAVGISTTLFETICYDVNYDPYKAALILDRAILKITTEVDRIYPWSHKLTNIRSFVDGNLTKKSELSQIKENFIKLIENIISLIKKYELGIGESSMVRMACKVSLEHLDSQISINEIAQSLFISKAYLCELFKDKTGLTFSQYITIIKIERSKFLISENELKIYEIANLLGYEDNVYFSHLFKKITGMSPSEYKQNPGSCD